MFKNIFKEVIIRISRDLELSEQSKRTYINRLENIIKFIPKYWSLNFLILNPEKYIKRLNQYLSNTTDNINLNTKYSYIYVILLIIENKDLEIYKLWNGELKKIKDQIDENRNKNKASEKQKRAYISLDEINKIKNELEIGSIDRLILSLYTSIPPVRNDFHNCRIYENYRDVDDDKLHDGNYIILNEKKIVLKEYKTSKRYGTNVIEIPDVLLEEIRESLKNYPREYLFVNRWGNVYKDPNVFNVYLNSRLKKILNSPDFHLTLFRHIYINELDLNKSTDEKSRVAKNMGHSVITQDKYRIKI